MVNGWGARCFTLPDRETAPAMPCHRRPIGLPLHLMVSGNGGGRLPLTFPDVSPSFDKVGICSDAGVRNFAGVAHKSRVARVTSRLALRRCGTVAHKSRVARVTSRLALRWCGTGAHKSRVARVTSRQALRRSGRSLTNPGWRA